MATDQNEFRTMATLVETGRYKMLAKVHKYKGTILGGRFWIEVYDKNSGRNPGGHKEFDTAEDGMREAERIIRTYTKSPDLAIEWIPDPSEDFLFERER